MSTHPNSNNQGGVLKAIVLFVIAIWMIRSAFWTNNHAPAPSPTTHQVAASKGPSINPIAQRLKPPANVPTKDGIAAAILMDTSGSMQESVTDADGKPRTKIEIARRSARDLLHRIDQFTKQNPTKTVMVGLYEFSVRECRPLCRRIVPLGPLNLAAAEPAIDQMVPDGATPIGDAIITAKQDLDRTGLTRMHILVVTDGESNRGYTPGDVADAITRLPEQNRASVYFIAFDVAAETFKPVRDAGGLVLPAANEQELRQTLNYVLTGKILVEQPDAPKSKTP